MLLLNYNIDVFVDLKICLNYTLAIDSSFQTFAEEFSSSTSAFSRNASSLNKLRIFLFNVYLALFVRRMTQLQLLNSTGKYCHLVN